MIIDLRLSLTRESGILMPPDYHYLFSAIIYKKIALEDPGFASDFHDKGFGRHRTKFFTFSDFRVRITSNGDRIELLDRIVCVTICFHHEDVAYKFIAGLMKEKEFSIHDIKSSVIFTVTHVETQEIDVGDGLMRVIAEPVSPCVSGYKFTGMSNYRFFSPDMPEFCDFIVTRMVLKYREVYPGEQANDAWFKRNVRLRALPIEGVDIKERTVVISPGKTTQCTLYGWTNFYFEITAPAKFIKLMFDTGVGVGNSQGCGCLKLIKKTVFHATRQLVGR